jgi:hypothetical protein
MIAFFKRRLREGSTWAAIGAAVTGAAALPSPYSWIVIGLGVCGVLAPSPSSKSEE